MNSSHESPTDSPTELPPPPGPAHQRLTNSAPYTCKGCFRHSAPLQRWEAYYIYKDFFRVMAGYGSRDTILTVYGARRFRWLHTTYGTYGGAARCVRIRHACAAGERERGSAQHTSTVHGFVLKDRTGQVRMDAHPASRRVSHAAAL